LDISGIADEPDFYVAYPLSPEMLQDLYGTTQPSLAAVEANMDFFRNVPRGQCIYIVCYTVSMPTELFFAGRSYD
jgi:hypothetical protein